MAILQIKSNNPNLSYVIAKNPETGLIAKKLRLGQIFGYFSHEDTTYNIYFKDAPNQISYKASPDQQFEYLDTSRYGSPNFILNAITLYLGSLMKGGVNEELDTKGFENQVTVNFCKIHHEKYIELFTKYLPDYKITAEPVAKGSYRLTISTNERLVDLVNFTALFTVFNVLKHPDEYLEGDPQQVAKYIQCLDVIKAPYFLKYVFKVNLLRSAKYFKKFKDILEKDPKDNIQMVIGSTSEQRRNFLLENLNFNYHICEIGCGSGDQTVSFAKQAYKRNKQLFAIDTDVLCREATEKRVKYKNFDNVQVLESFEAFKKTEKPESRFEYVLSEVIEHMDKDEASKLTKDIIEYATQQDVSSLVITTPNADFNQYYDIDGFRHDDHHFEFTENEFKNWINQLLKPVVEQIGYIQEYSFFGIGDIVNGIPTTLAVRIVFRGDLLSDHQA